MNTEEFKELTSNSRVEAQVSVLKLAMDIFKSRTTESLDFERSALKSFEAAEAFIRVAKAKARAKDE